MEAPSRFFSVLAAVLFAAACAWIGAGLYAKAESPETAELQYVTVLDSAELRGVAVRSEQSVSFGRTLSPAAESGKRVPAGGVLAEGDDGSVTLCEGSAVYFDCCDGYEYLCPEMLNTLSAASLTKLLGSRPEKAGGGRLVAGHDWYYAALVRDSPALPSSGGCRVLFDGFTQPVDASILSLSAPEGGYRALLLRLTAGGEEYLSLRKTEAQLIFSEYSGLKIPQEAVHTAEDGAKFVYTLSSGAFIAEGVDIIYTGAGYSLAGASACGGALREGSRVLIGDT